MVLEVRFESEATRQALRRLTSALGRPEPVLKLIGEDLAESTRQRFQSSTGPDGRPWARNKPTTIARLMGRTGGNYKKDGSLSKRGATRLASKKPLIGETRALSSTINWQVSGGVLSIGSPQVYAGTMQFGAKQGEFGRSRRNGPIPWGDIPARPFLGISAQDEKTIEEVLARFIKKTTSG